MKSGTAMGHPGRNRAKQGGYALLGTLFSLAILGAIIVMMARIAERDTLQKRSQIEGNAMSQFAIGLRGFVAAAQANPSLIPAGAQKGVNWLKAPTCGGLPTNPAEGYVSCSFTGATFGGGYSTSFTYLAATNQIEARSNVLITSQGYSAKDAPLMADRMAETAASQQALPSNGMFNQVFANVPANASGPATGSAFFNPGVNAGRVVLLVTNAPSNDFWLRTDGTNQMLANLNMGGRSIANARDGSFAGNVRVGQAMQVDQGLTVANGSADLRGGVVTTDVAMTDIGVFASQGVYSAEVLTGATTYQVAKPRCSSTASVPKIFASLQATGTTNVDGYQADSIYSSRVDVSDIGGAWQVTPVVVGTRFDMSVSGSTITLNKSNPTITPRDARIVVLRKCS